MTNTNTVKTPTIRDRYNELLALSEVQAHPELVEFINGRLVQLENKTKNKVNKPTKNQLENLEFKSDIVAWLEPNRVYSVAEIAKGLSETVGKEVTSNRVTPILTSLTKEGVLVRTEEKGRARYALADAEGDVE